MKTVMVLAMLALIGCAKKAENGTSGSASLAAACEAPTNTTHDFVNWPQESAKDYNCPNVYPKMSCHYYVGASGVSELVCEDIDATDPHGVPDGYIYYIAGYRHFLNDTYGSASAYDGGVQFGLRCFYFSASGSPANENIVCQ